ncbi:MAG: hypothetical protein FJX29_15240, partial [Alphaproteobacteria bacterium]|nr:hypothetical protein [Alphaproteobacteria bacterium]
MTRTFLAACFASGWLALPVSPAIAQAGRLDFCARPVAPACVDVISTYKDSAGREACSAEVRRFLDMT